MYKKFFRRFLPFVLSVTMMVEMIPATAFAAEAPTGQEAVIEDAAAEEPVVSAEPEKTDDVTGESVIVEAVDEDTVDLNTFDDGETTLVTAIKVYNGTAEVTGPVKENYTAAADNPLAAVVDYTYKLYVNGEYVKDLAPTDPGVSFQWQKLDADGATWNNVSVPKDAGTYQYVVKVAKLDGQYEEKEVAVACEIEPIRLEVRYGTYDDDGVASESGSASTLTARPGSTVKDFVDSVKEKIVVKIVPVPATPPLYYSKSQMDEMFSLEIVVKDKAGNVLAPDASPAPTFNYNDDYKYSIVVKAAEKLGDNYVFGVDDAYGYALENRAVKVSKAVDTKIVISDAAGYEFPEFTKVTSTADGNAVPALEPKTYDGVELKVTDIVPETGAAKIGAVVYVRDDDGDVEIAGLNYKALTDEDAQLGKLTVEWWDSNRNCKLEKDPVDAGLYTLRVAYAGKDGIYKEAEAFIHVRIKAVETYIMPQVASDAKFYTGMTEKEVLDQIEYALRLKETEKDYEFEEGERDTFWGVSYNNPYGNYKQSYVPLFKLVYADKDKDGNVVKEDGKEVYRDNSGLKDQRLDPKKRAYRVVFTGNKGFYNASGQLVGWSSCSINEKSVNSACNNYDVLVDEKTLEERFAAITVESAKETTVDTAKILKDGKGASFYDPIVNVFSDDGIYAKRAEYKMAGVKDASGTLFIEDTETKHDDRLTYRWQVFTGNWDYSGETPEPDYDYIDLPLNGPWYGLNDDNQKAPKAVGRYRLHITFNDPTHEYAGSEEYVYYEVQPQFVAVKPAGDYVAYTNTTDADFLNSYDFDENYAIYKIVGNDYKDDYAAQIAAGQYEDNKLDLTKLDEDGGYDIEWIVERSVKKDDGSGEDTGEYEENNGRPFVKDYSYRLNAKFTWTPADEKYADHYTEYLENDAKNEVNFNIPLDITLKEMGSKKVDLYINRDKFTTVYKVYDGEAIDAAAMPGLITVLDHNDGTDITDSFPVQDIKIFWDVEYDTDPVEKAENLKEARDAGKYTMKLRFYGNEDYYWTKDSNGWITGGSTGQGFKADDICVIARRPLSIQPVLTEQIKAGERILKNVRYKTYAGVKTNTDKSADFDLAQYKYGLDGVAEADKDAFTPEVTYDEDGNRNVTIPVFGSTFNVVGADDEFRYYDYTRILPDVYEAKNDAAAKAAGNKYKSHTEYYAKTSVPAKPHMYSNSTTITYNDDGTVGNITDETDAPDRVMKAPYCYNYEITNEKSDPLPYFADFVGSQIIKLVGGTDLRDAIVKGTEETPDVHQVIPCEGLTFYTTLRDYYKNMDNELALLPEGNYFIFTIKAPEEFNAPDGVGGYGNLLTRDAETALFRNAIAKAGGSIVNLKAANGELTVAFPAKADSENATFDIWWKEGCVENFEVVLKGALLKDDLTKAVLPKSMKFNAVNKKMAVGETQQLDVKVIKKQVKDVIAIGYSVSEKDAEFLSVTDNGLVTALKKGSATVTAYPIRYDQTGKIEKIPGGKAVSVKIKIGDIVKPSVTKVTGMNNWVTIKYKKPANGYRREFYIMEGKIKKADVFEANIRNYGSDWKNLFAAAPLYGDGTEAPVGILTKVIGGLKYNQEYTVYVRNVSGIRTLADGSAVAINYAGTLKTFKTTKENIQGLDVDLDDPKGEYELKEMSDDGYHLDDPKSAAYYDCEGKGYCYEVPFTAKTVQLTSFGKFHEVHENDAAESYDVIWKKLPMTAAADKNNYVVPKIAYFATDGTDFIVDAKIAKQQGYKVKIGTRYYKPSTVAAVNKKGKMTLKGLGRVYIWAYDSITGRSDYHCVHVTAKVDSFTGKSAKVKVGQAVNIYKLLEYKVSGKKVAGDPRVFAEPYTMGWEDSKYFIYDGTFCAKEPGPYTIEVTDKTVGEDAKATVTINVTGLDPVKKLKKVYVYANEGMIKFSYMQPFWWNGEEGMWIYENGVDSTVDPVGNDSKNPGKLVKGVDFRVDIRDSVGKLVYSEIIDGNSEITTANGKVWEYEHYFRSNDLGRRSKYKLTVTPFYGDQTGKPVTITLKTSDYPVSTADMDKDVWEWTWVDRNDNGRIDYFDYDEDGVADDDEYEWLRVKDALSNEEYYDDDTKTPGNRPGAKGWSGQRYGEEIDAESMRGFANLQDSPFFTSGSTYVLHIPNAESTYEQRAVTDTVSWKVRDGKVASVKAVPGTHTAKLTAKKPGTTILEARSKITKKVFARYKIYVKAVGDGHDFHGDYDDGEVEWDPTYQKAVETVSVENPLAIQQGDQEYTWVCYDVKEEGYHEYFVNNIGSVKGIRLVDTNTKDGSKNITVGGWNPSDDSVTPPASNPKYLYEGMKVYFKIQGEEFIHVSCKPTVSMPAAGKLQLQLTASGEAAFTYTASADGVYIFSSKEDFCKGSSAGAATFVKQNNHVAGTTYATYAAPNADTGLNELTVRMDKGDTILVKVQGNANDNYEVAVDPKEFKELTVSETNELTVKKDKDTWFKFTAEIAGLYEFKTVDAAETITGEYAKPFNEIDNAKFSNLTPNGKDVALVISGKNEIAMKAGDSYAFKLQCTSGDADEVKVKFSVSRKAEEKLALGQQDIKIKDADKVVWAAYEVEEDGDYIVNATSTAALNTDYKVSYRYLKKKDGSDNPITAGVKKALEKGDIVYVELTSVTDAEKTITISITEVKVDAVLKADADAIEVKYADREEYWYEFTAPRYGMYDFRIVVKSNDTGDPKDADNSNTHLMTAVKYNAVGDTTPSGGTYDINYADTSMTSSRTIMTAGEKAVFKLSSATILGEPKTNKTTVTVQVKECRFVDFAKADEQEFSLARGEIGYYKFVAPDSADSYDFTMALTAGSIGYATNIADKNVLSAVGARNTHTAAYTGTDTTAPGIKIKKGDTYYFIVEHSGDAEAKAEGKITVKKSAPTEITYDTTTNATTALAQTEKIPAGGNEKWFSYIAKETARYYVTAYTSDTNDCDVELHSSYDDTATTKIDEVPAVLVAGRTYYIKVKNTDPTIEDVAVKIEKVVPKKTLAAGAAAETAAVTDKSHDAWYDFTADTPGLYEFECEVVDAGAECYYTPAAKTGSTEYPLTTGAAAGKYPVIFFMDKGDTYYFNIRTGSATAVSANLKVTKITPAGALTTAEAIKNVQIKAGETVWYSFTALADGEYTFKKGDSDKNIVVTDFYLNKAGKTSPYKKDLYGWINPIDGSSVAAGSDLTAYTGSYPVGTTQLQLARNDKVLMAITTAAPDNTTDVTFDLSVAMKEVTDVTPAAGLALKAGTTPTYVRFKAYKAGMYIVRTEGADSDADISINGSFIHNDNSAGKGLYAVINLGDGAYSDTYTITADKDVNCTLKLEKAITSDSILAAEEEAKSYTVPKNGGITYAVCRIEEDGLYVLNAEPEKKDGTAKKVNTSVWYTSAETLTDASTWWNSADDSLTPTGTKVTRWLGKEDVVIFMAVNSDDTDATTKISVGKVEAVSVTGDAATDTFEDGAVIWYRYEAKSTAAYKFAGDKLNNLGVYREMTDDTSEALTIPAAGYLLSKGDVVYIRVENDKGAKVESNKVTVTSDASEETFNKADATATKVGIYEDEDSKGNNVYTIAKNVEYVYYSFTAPQDGRYTFAAKLKDADSRMDIYENGVLNGDTAKNRREYTTFIPAGKTVVIRNRNAFAAANEGDSWTLDVTIRRNYTVLGLSAKGVQAPVVWHIDEDDGSTVIDVKDCYYYYTAPETGWYEFTSYRDEKLTRKARLDDFGIYDADYQNEILDIDGAYPYTSGKVYLKKDSKVYIYTRDSYYYNYFINVVNLQKK